MRGILRQDDASDSVVGATVLLFGVDSPTPLGVAQTDQNGTWSVELPALGERDRPVDIYVVVRAPGGRVLADTHGIPIRVWGPDVVVDIAAGGSHRTPDERPRVRVGPLLLDAEEVAKAEPETVLDIVRSLGPASVLTSESVRRLTALSPRLAPTARPIPFRCDSEVMAAVHRLIELKGWPRELARRADELLSLRALGVPTHTHRSPNFAITYCTREESADAGVDPDTSAQTVVEPGTTTVLAMLPGGGPPTYVKRIAYWLERALAGYTNPPFSFRNPAATGPIPVEVNTHRIGNATATTFDINRALPPEFLACVCVHELFHRVQYQYPGLDGPGYWTSSMREGGAVWAEDALMDAVNRYLFQAGPVPSDFGDSGILTRPHIGLELIQYGAGLFWRYIAEQHSVRSPGAETYRQIIESCSAGSWSGDDIKRALRTMPWHQDLYEFSYLDPGRLDLISAETTLGNFAVACYLKDRGAHVPDRRFTFMENSAHIFFDDLLRTFFGASIPPVDTLAPVTVEARALSSSGSTCFCSWVGRYGSRYCEVSVDPGVIAARLEFAADENLTGRLLQIVLIDETGVVRDIHRTDKKSYTKQVPNVLNGRRLDRIVLVVTGAPTNGDFAVTLNPAGPAPDVMVTRWNSALKSEYEIDPRGSDWTWTSPDVWVASNGGALLLDVDNALTIRLHNKGNADASGISVQFDYQEASGALSPVAWRLVQNKAGVTQSLTGLSLATGSSNQWRVDWSPVSSDGTHEFCVRAIVTVPGDPNTDNKRVLSRFRTGLTA